MNGETNGNGRRGSWLLGFAKIGLAGGIIYYLVHRGDIEPRQLASALAQNHLIAFLVFAVVALSYVGQGLRWHVILRDRGVHLCPWQTQRYLMIGKFFNLVVPGNFSEDIVRALYVVRLNAASRTRVLLSLMADRAAGILALVLLSAAGLVAQALFGNGHSGGSGVALASLRSTVGLLGAGGITVIVGLRLCETPPGLVAWLATRLHLRGKVDDAWDELRYYATSSRLQSKVLALSLCNQTCVVASFVLLGHTLGVQGVGVAEYFMFVPLGMLVTTIPIAPLGLGVGHLAFLTLFRMAGTPEGANLFSLYTAVCILLNLSGGLFYLGLGKAAEPRAEAVAGAAAAGGKQ